MSANIDTLVQGIRAKRSEKLPQAKARLEKLKAAKEAVLTTRTRAAAVAANNAELQVKLSGISYDKALTSINAAVEACERSVSRLSRESINIGVAGKSGQGKSQILQKLTGLKDEQIPTGGGGACTAARSIVHNGSSRFAKVHYLTRDGLLAKKVYPSYEPRQKDRPFALGLSSRRPVSLEDFLAMELPSVETGDGTPTQAEDNWQKVLDLQRVLRAHPELVGKLDSVAESVDIAKVRDYIVKDNGETLHNVVDFVEITTPFEIGLPEGLTVYDLPGLADPTPGIREDMFASLKNDADIVLFLRKAATDGDRDLWWDVDKAAIDLMKGVYSVEEVKPADWIQLVLNLDSRDGHVNSRNTEELRKTVTKGFVPVVCDCGKADAVRAMINENIERLVGNVARIDDLQIRQADAGYSAALDEVRAVYRNLREASADIVADQCGFDFKRKFTDFMSDLRDPLKKDLKDLSPELMAAIKDILVRNFSGAAQKMKDLYAAFDDKDDFPADFPIYSKRYLTSKFGASNAPLEPIGESVRNQREALFKLCREVLEGCCQKLNAAYFENVAAKVFENKAVSMATRDLVSSATGPKGKIEAFAALLNREGRSPTLASAVAGLLSFNLTFESTILPALYGVPAFADFNPENPTPNFSDMVMDINSIQTKEERAACLYNWQKWRCEQILSDATSGTDRSPLAVITTYVSNIMQANFSSFVFSFIWGEDCTNEWERLVKSNQSVFWKEEYEAAARNSEISCAWSDALSGLRTFVG